MSIKSRIKDDIKREKVFPNTVITEQFKEEVFIYLDSLRESGITNMFGAAPYIEINFKVNTTDSRKLLKEWMETFPKRHSNGNKQCLK